MDKENFYQSQQLQQKKEEIEAALARLSNVGFVGESRLIDGKLHYRFGLEHMAKVYEVLSHPEMWPDHWSDKTKAKMHTARDAAIARGMIVSTDHAPESESEEGGVE